MKKTILLFTNIFLIISCSGEKENIESKPQINTSFLENVKTIPAELKSQEEDLTLSGKVEYDPDKLVNYVPLINGVVTRTYFSLGDKVHKGQILADVKSMEINSLRSEKATLESELKTARRELQSAQSMYKDNMISERELIEAKAKVKQAEATLGRVHSDMSITGSNRGGGFSIISPISGYIISKNISTGTAISPDTEPVFVVADLSEVWITANVYASNLLFVKEGMQVEMSSLSYPGEIFNGKINHVSQVFDSEEKVLKARIIMPNPQLKFKPEMSMIIKLKNNTENRKVSVPTDALIFDNDQYFVVVEESDKKFKIKEINLQGHNENTAYISSGLSEGELVVVKNQLLIYSQLKDQ